jgi:hypothetical protein
LKATGIKVDIYFLCGLLKRQAYMTRETMDIVALILATMIG